MFVCSGSKSKKLGTVAVNVFIALYQLSSLTGGLLADWLLGNFQTQNLSNILGTVGIALVFFATWQYSLNQPDCCDPHLNHSSHTPSSSCNELDKHRILTSLSVNFPPEAAVLCIIIGCIVRLTLFILFKCFCCFFFFTQLLSIGYGHTNAIQSVFVGDQFPEGPSTAKEKSFSWFYLFQNVGSLANESGIPFSRQSLGFVTTFLIIAGT